MRKTQRKLKGQKTGFQHQETKHMKMRLTGSMMNTTMRTYLTSSVLVVNQNMMKRKNLLIKTKSIRSVTVLNKFEGRKRFKLFYVGHVIDIFRREILTNFLKKRKESIKVSFQQGRGSCGDFKKMKFCPTQKLRDHHFFKINSFTL